MMETLRPLGVDQVYKSIKTTSQAKSVDCNEVAQ
jgi:hypothetical protein